MDVDHSGEMGLTEGLKVCCQSDKAQSEQARTVALRYGQIRSKALNFLDAAMEVEERRFTTRVKLRELWTFGHYQHPDREMQDSNQGYMRHVLLFTFHDTT